MQPGNVTSANLKTKVRPFNQVAVILAISGYKWPFPAINSHFRLLPVTSGNYISAK